MADIFFQYFSLNWEFTVKTDLKKTESTNHLGFLLIEQYILVGVIEYIDCIIAEG